MKGFVDAKESQRQAECRSRNIQPWARYAGRHVLSLSLTRAFVTAAVLIAK